ncbi:MAG: hypothetical protein FJ145_19075 [Deltaproteobacteria bacterium]|nr:hypothetical protein [Deltaproteobacteria bacterium]
MSLPHGRDLCGYAAFLIDHVISQQRGGADEDSNLCLGCFRCDFKPDPTSHRSTTHADLKRTTSTSRGMGTSSVRRREFSYWCRRQPVSCKS